MSVESSGGPAICWHGLQWALGRFWLEQVQGLRDHGDAEVLELKAGAVASNFDRELPGCRRL